MKFKGFIASWAMCVALVVPASSHPHVFIDAEVGFDLSNDGQLMAVSITWIYDPFTSLTLIDLLDLDQDNDGVMSDADLARIVQAQTVWPDSFNGDTLRIQTFDQLPQGRTMRGLIRCEHARQLACIAKTACKRLASINQTATKPIVERQIGKAFVVQPGTDHGFTDRARRCVVFQPDGHVERVCQVRVDGSVAPMRQRRRGHKPA